MSSQPSHVVVRPALPEDLAALQELARRTIDACYRSFLGDEGVDWFIGSGASDEHIASHFAQGRVHCLEADGGIAGLMILEGPTVDLMMIDVRHHRRGLGAVLLSAAEEVLFAEYGDIRLETFVGNTAAIAFYEACGWTAAGRTDTGSDTPAKIEFVKHRREEGAGSA
ncbi:GNAT family N-acetyltransferase [Streptomyces narbonensis]|uniref:GNAT family N-acetyltransferase n=1 Tax=Streptomyces narbonensis TaxID=67333 RepID=UPI00199D287B|nr:GNAT family N-acetyltransferase [Streptomyces narbonensis]GGW06232.1 GNAT family N-acetyltransferase [Streptomyces narbonensis]